MYSRVIQSATASSLRSRRQPSIASGTSSKVHDVGDLLVRELSDLGDRGSAQHLDGQSQLLGELAERAVQRHLAPIEETADVCPGPAVPLVVSPLGEQEPSPVVGVDVPQQNARGGARRAARVGERH